MNRIASILTSLSIVVLLFASAARAQYNDRKITATIPFEFIAGNRVLPAGQYVFLRTGANLLQIRNPEGRDLVTVSTGSVQATQLPTATKLRFSTMNGTHVLAQVWGEHEAIGSEIYHARSNVEVAKYPRIHGTSAGRR
jgi:hypothetical protein